MRTDTKPINIPLLFLSKNWIGNERKRKGLALKRAPRDPTNTLKYVPGQKRKKSSYSVFKSTYLSSETGKILVYSWNHHSGTKAKHIIFSAMHFLPPRIRIVCAYIRM